MQGVLLLRFGDENGVWGVSALGVGRVRFAKGLGCKSAALIARWYACVRAVLHRSDMAWKSVVASIVPTIESYVVGCIHSLRTSDH